MFVLLSELSIKILDKVFSGGRGDCKSTDWSWPVGPLDKPGKEHMVGCFIMLDILATARSIWIIANWDKSEKWSEEMLFLDWGERIL